MGKMLLKFAAQIITFVVFCEILENAQCRKVANCTYSFQFQEDNDNVACRKYADSKAVGLNKTISSVFSRVGKARRLLREQGNGVRCRDAKSYVISYTDCQAARDIGLDSSGVFELRPIKVTGKIVITDPSDTSVGVAHVDVGPQPVTAFCDLESDARYGWLVIMQRIAPFSLDMNKTWSDYKKGFGNVGRRKEFWLGFDKVRQMFPQKANMLIEVTTNSSGIILKHYINYINLRIAPEEDNFVLSWDTRLGEHVYQMNEGNKFQTWDHWREGSYRNCAAYTTLVGGGGWWFSGNPRCSTPNCDAYKCGSSNLNARTPYWSGFQNIVDVQMKMRARS